MTLMDPYQMESFVKDLVKEAIEVSYRAVVVLPCYVPMARYLLNQAHSRVHLATVVSFPEGTDLLKSKLHQIKDLMAKGADELDVVMNYNAYKKGDHMLLEREITECTHQTLKAGKIIKWIIETAALDTNQILKISQMIRDITLSRFGFSNAQRVYVKSSTGFFSTPEGIPNGATLENIKIMCENAAPLAVKASGGIMDVGFAHLLIKAGAQRLGTSLAKKLMGKPN